MFIIRHQHLHKKVATASNSGNSRPVGLVASEDQSISMLINERFCSRISQNFINNV